MVMTMNITPTNIVSPHSVNWVIAIIQYSITTHAAIVSPNLSPSMNPDSRSLRRFCTRRESAGTKDPGAGGAGPVGAGAGAGARYSGGSTQYDGGGANRGSGKSRGS